jgi:hypothetical protein
MARVGTVNGLGLFCTLDCLSDVASAPHYRLSALTGATESFCPTRTGYRHYKSDPAQCRACPLIASCTANAKAERTGKRFSTPPFHSLQKASQQKTPPK